MAKKLEKMTNAEIRDYYEKRAYIIGSVFAFVLVAIAIIGFFVGFNGPDLLGK